MVSGDDVQLPDLQVIQRYSLAVRGATAPVADVIEALQSDLAWLTGAGRRRPAEPATRRAPAKSAVKTAAAPKAAAKKAPAKKAAVKRAPAKSPARKTAAKKSGARRA